MRKLLAFLRSKVFWAQMAMALVLSVVLVFLILHWLKGYTHHGEFVAVPDFSKMSVMDMRKKTEEMGLRYEVLDSANYNPEYPRFSILEQNPPAGSKVKTNRKIYFTVNPSGYKKVAIPKIQQVTLRNATAMLRAVGLDLQRVTYIDEIGKDMVYYIKFKGKEVKPGDRVPKTSKLELVCGNGGEEEKPKITTEAEQ